MSIYLQGVVEQQSDLGLFAERDRFDNVCDEEAMSFDVRAEEETV
jgi:hypothetical protein